MIERKVTHHSAASATATGAVMNTTGLVGALVQITGIYAATVTFQGTIDGSNWVAIRAESPTSGVVATTAVATGMYYVPFAGIRLFRANMVWSSGTSITVTSIGIGSPPSHPFAAEDLGFGLANVLVPGSIKGKIIYVDTAANGALDTNDGLSAGTAKLTISGALDACTDYMWDTIVVLNYTSASEIEWPISVDVHGVRIIGAPGGGYMPRYTGGQVIDSTGDKACMTLDANHIHIAQLEFRAGASFSGIMFDTAAVGRHGIYDCVFHSGAYGVWATALTKPQGAGPTIKNCFFESALTDGIRYQSDAAFARFEDNIFDHVSGIAINISATNGAAGFVLNNIISLRSATAAKGIVIGLANYRWVFDGNHANYDRSNMAANPYLDTCTQFSGTNSWLVNYAGLNRTMPAIS